VNEGEKATERALTFLEKRDRTEAEVRERLAKSGFSEDAVNEAVLKLKELGFIDDADYAARYLEALVAKGRGRLRISTEMRRKGLADFLIKNTLEDGYSAESERAAAQTVAEKTIGELPIGLLAENPRKAYEKINRRLVGRGFSYAIIGEVMEKLRANRD